MSQDGNRTGVTMDVHVGDSVKIDGGLVVIRIEHKSGQKARLRIEAPKSMHIARTEARKRIPVTPG